MAGASGARGSGARGRSAPVMGMTALVPPELVFASGWRPLDVNNWIPDFDMRPRSKLCAWTACWRDAIVSRSLPLDALVVVAGGDCHNALADGQRAARAVPRSHYFFYPFDGDEGYMRDQLDALADFLGRGGGEALSSSRAKRALDDVASAKRVGAELERARAEGRADPAEVFRALVSMSDLEGDVGRCRERLEGLLDEARGVGGGAERGRSGPREWTGGRGSRGVGRGEAPAGRALKGRVRRGAGAGGDSSVPTSRSRAAEELTSSAPEGGGARVALIGVPPIYRDFHKACAGAGLRVVFDELPHEFLRLGGRSIQEMARSYATYTFARPLEHRLRLLKRELKMRRVDGVIHYAQFTCHHILEDPLLREELDWPMLTIQGDLPGPTPAQARLRLEAFGELLGASGGR